MSLTSAKFQTFGLQHLKKKNFYVSQMKESHTGLKQQEG